MTNNIYSIVTNKNTVVVRVLAPEGTNQVTLQAQEAGSGGGWKPLAVERKSGGKKELVFRVPKSKAAFSYRAVVEPVPLPSHFYRGRTAFAATKGKSSNLSQLTGTLAAPVGRYNYGELPATGVSAPETGTASDVWKLDGNRLYFFDQSRGLEVIDLSNPDSPALLGTLNLPLSGDELYVVDQNHVVLVAQDCSGTNDTELVLVDVSTGSPTLVTNIALGGTLVDSRQAGTSLYCASSALVHSGNYYFNGTQIESFDFSNSSSPAAVASLTFSNELDVFTVSGGYLLAAESFGGTSVAGSPVECINIAAGHGSMSLDATITTAGTVADSFDLSASGNIISTISAVYYDYDTNYEVVVSLETFSINESGAAPAGALALTNYYYGAARFDSNRAYLATQTYTQMLLDVIDLSDPSNPVVAGSTDIGISDQIFMDPMGNRLITIGPGNYGGPRISLFDVSNVSQPTLLSEVDLSTNLDWNEIGYDPNAFTFVPENGLIIAPCVTYTGYVPQFNAQLIDWTSTSLVLRGQIPGARVQSAALVDNRVVAVSDTTLVSANIADQDNPTITSALKLSWPVDQVFLNGNYIVELSTGLGENAAPMLTVAAASAPDVGLAQWTLTSPTVLGAVERDGLLYLLEGHQPQLFVDALFEPTFDTTDSTNGATLTLTIVDLHELPAITIVAETNVYVSQPVSSGVTAVWPTNGTLVWVASGEQEFFWPLASLPPKLRTPVAAAPHMAAIHDSAISGVAVNDPWIWSWIMGGGGIEMIAFNVSNATNPTSLSTVIVGTNGSANGNAVFATNGLVYVSHAVWHQLPPPPANVVVPKGGLPNAYDFAEKNELDVVDFTIPTAPVVRDEVQIPGALAGIGNGGNIVYTSDFDGALSALAYDGVNSYLAATLPPPKDRFQVALVAGDTVFTAQSTSSDDAASELNAWSLNASGRFVKVNTLRFSQRVYGLANFGNLLAVQNGSGITLVDVTRPSKLVTVGGGSANGCIWLGLTGADGALGAGLWTPLGNYGVMSVPPLTP